MKHTGPAEGTDQAPEQGAAALQASQQPSMEPSAKAPGTAAALQPPEGSNSNSSLDSGTGDPPGAQQGQGGVNAAGVEAPCDDKTCVEQPMCVRDLLAAERGRIEAAAYAMPEIPGAMPALFAAHMQGVESDDDCVLIP